MAVPGRRKIDPELERQILDVVSRNADILVPKKKDPIRKPTWVDTPPVAAAQNWSTTNLGVFTPVWIPNACKVLNFTINITTSANNLDMAVYDKTGHRMGGNLGSTASPGIGLRTFTFGTPIVIPHADTYYLAIACNGTTLNYNYYDLNSGGGLLNFTATSVFPLPVAVSMSGAASNRPPWISAELTSTDGA